MSILRAWASRHNIPFAAVYELEALYGLHAEPDIVGDMHSEKWVQSHAILEGAQKGIRLFRNNVGALKDSRGVPVRYGLANDSSKLNKEIKSGDLIGIETIQITSDMVGSFVGRFISVECKETKWAYTGDDHERAQLAWAEFVISRGGRALFVNNRGMI